MVIRSTLICILASSAVAVANIYQYKDCDGNGTLLLTKQNAAPNSDLSNLYLECANLSGRKIWGSDFSYSDLRSADMSDLTDAKWADFSYADLQDANLWWAVFSSANFSSANLMGANLSISAFSLANFNGANLSGADLTGGYFFGAEFHGADLTGADLAEADFTEAEFFGAELASASGWESAVWTGALYGDSTVFPGGMKPDAYGMVFVNTGACCFLKEFCYWECLELSENDCMAEYAATWYGTGSRCDEITCPDPCYGACCIGGTRCALTVQALCEAEEGTFHAYKMCDEIECECPGDLNGDGTVNILDLLKVINYWGACP